MGVKQGFKFINRFAPKGIISLKFSDFCVKFKKEKLKANSVPIIFVDGSIYIFKALNADFYTPDDLKSHYHVGARFIRFFLKQYYIFLSHGIELFYIFDGKTSQKAKEKTVLKRKEAKARQDERNETRAAASRTAAPCGHIPHTLTVTDVHMKLLYSTFDHYGIKYMITDNCEGEAVAAFLARRDKSVVLSEDFDVLPFGTTIVRCSRTGVKATMNTYSLPKILKELNITYHKFIDLCIILGTDFNKPITSSIIKANTIIREKTMFEICEGVLTPDEITRLRLLFSDPIVKCAGTDINSVHTVSSFKGTLHVLERDDSLLDIIGMSDVLLLEEIHTYFPENKIV